MSDGMLGLVLLVIVLLVYFIMKWMKSQKEDKYKWPGDNSQAVVMWFHKKSCPYCVEMEADYQAAKEIVKDNPGIKFVDIDLEDLKSMPEDIKARYQNIFAAKSKGTVPFVCFSFQGTISELQGDRSKKTFEDFFKYVADLRNAPKKKPTPPGTSGQLPANLANADLPN